MKQTKTTNTPSGIEANTLVSIFLEGEHVSLRPFIESDISNRYLAWFNNPEICAGNSHHIFPLTFESAKAYLENTISFPENLILAIIDKETQSHIGNISLNRINYIHRSASINIIIGQKEAWGKGFGEAACRLLVQHAFNALNLNRIYCGTYENNEGMIRLAKALGMTQEGVRRDAGFKDGSYMSFVEFGILKSEYSSNA